MAAMDAPISDDLPRHAGSGCAPLSELVATQELCLIELQRRIRTLFAPLERAGFAGNLTITFRKPDNSPVSRIKSVEIVQM